MHTDCTFGTLIYGHKVMAISVVDSEGQVRLVSFTICPGHTEEDWLEMFNSTSAFCGKAESVVCMADGEDAIEVAFHNSSIPSTATKQTCSRHAAWTSAKRAGVDAAERFHSRCVNACCEAEFVDKCTALVAELREEGPCRVITTFFTRANTCIFYKC